MKNLSLFLMGFFMFLGTLKAQNAQIAGYVYDNTNFLPVAGQEVWLNIINSPDGNFATTNSTFTNGEGYFMFALDSLIENGQINDGQPLIVFTQDYCTSSGTSTQVVNYYPNVQVQLNFFVCANQTQNCDANFVYEISDNKVVYFSNLSSENMEQFQWDFGDGTSSTQENPVPHLYADGIYNVQLTAYNSEGCIDYHIETIYVGNANNNYCNSDFLYYQMANYFVFRSAQIENITSCFWDFGDGQTSDQLFSTEHTYVQNGVYTVCLTITAEEIDPNGEGTACTSTSCQTVIVGDNNECPLTFAYEFSAENSLQVKFFDTYYADNLIAWSWNFGDGTTSNEPQAIHTYQNSDLYNVCLTGQFADGQECTTCQMVMVGDTIINPPLCTADFYYTQDSSANCLCFNFYDTSTPQAVNHLWDFGDNTISTEANPYHSYMPGIYNVCLTTTTADGCTSSACKILYLGDNNQCLAQFEYVQEGNMFKFYDTSFGNPIQWNWNLGDGTYANEPFVSHIYQESGIYNVCLEIITETGCTSTFCTSVFVNDSITNECNAYFEAILQEDVYCLYCYNFINFSQGNTQNSFWDFGDGHTSTEQNPTHIFNQPGLYTVCLTVSSENCESSYCMNLNVGENEEFLLTGNAFAGNYPLAEGFAFLINTQNNFENHRATIINNGQFTFNALGGQYIVLAFPDFNTILNDHYLPTFYGNTIFWQNANVVNLYQNTENININLVYFNWNDYGSGSISGNVLYLEGEADDFNNLTIVLLNMQNEVVKTTFIDENYGFRFENLPFGTYQIYAQKPGYQTYPLTVSVTVSNPNIEGITVEVGNGVIYTDESNQIIDSNFEIIAYPNPVIDVLNFNLENQYNADVSVEVFDAAGRLVVQKTFDKKYDNKTISLNVEHLQKGVYFAKVEVNKQHNYKLKFVK